MASKKNKIIILGGGLSGMAAADILAKDKNNQIIIFEKDDHMGGLAASFKHNGYYIPKYYHHVIKSNTYTQKYLKRYKKAHTLKWGKIKVVIGINKQLSNITSPFGLLGFKYLNLWEKFRFGLFGLYTIFVMDPSKIDLKLDAKTWLYKHAGKAVTDKIFYNLYARNKFNMDLSEISASQFANRLAEKEVYDDFAYPEGGIQTIVDGLEHDLTQKKVKMIKKASLDFINVTHKTVTVNGKTYTYDVLINTIPVPVFKKIAHGLPDSYLKKIDRLRYCPAVCITFGTDTILMPGVYWINLFQEQVQVIMQHSVLCDTYPDKITWALRYGGSEEDLQKSDDTIIKEYMRDVNKYFPGIKPNWIKVNREVYAEPIYDKDYKEYEPTYETEVEGLFNSGIQTTYPLIRSMNSALLSGENVVEYVKKYLKKR